ncbi:MAG TPA: asparagine synthetase B [Stellaceae bacterium]|nr:asparagine synthetase B [Stellaceae bacterium]
MSAIAGIWDFRGGRNAALDCARMLSAQAIYGRHGEKRWADGAVALGRRLTRLLPEDVYDTQPLEGRGSPFVLVADLRLDNREDLAAGLGLQGEPAKTMCDAALLLAAFERWDDECCDHLVGDYAFAIWDGFGHRLVLARDMIGSRPLHYHRGERFFAFASMPKGLHALADIPRAPDEERAAEFLALLPEHGSRSFFQGIERVEAGQIVTVTRAGLRARQHWRWQRRRLSLRSPGDYVEGLRHHLDRAVRSQLRGVDGRVAAHLSAGLDSAAVATTAARLLAPSGGKVVAFTAAPRAGYDLPAPPHRIGDEGSLAAATAAMHANIEHVLIRSGERSPLGTLDRDFFLFDRPLMNLCNYVWVHDINEAVRAGKLSVLFTGNMGNLTISYDGSELLAELLRGGQWIKWAHAVAAIVRGRHWRLRGALAASFAPWLPPGLWQLLCRVYYRDTRDIARYSAIHPARLAELDPLSRARGIEVTDRPPRDGVAVRLSALGWVDPGNYHKGTLAGWGIDVRDPTADRRLIEFCLSVPTEQFFRDGVPRALARAALADRIPPAVLNEKRRGLQAVDWHETLTAARPQVIDEIARLEQTAPAARALDLARLHRLATNWPTGDWEREDTIVQYRLALLRGISVGHFLRRASGGNA